MFKYTAHTLDHVPKQFLIALVTYRNVVKTLLYKIQLSGCK